MLGEIKSLRLVSKPFQLMPVMLIWDELAPRGARQGCIHKHKQPSSLFFSFSLSLSLSAFFFSFLYSLFFLSFLLSFGVRLQRVVNHSKNPRKILCSPNTPSSGSVSCSAPEHAAPIPLMGRARLPLRPTLISPLVVPSRSGAASSSPPR